MLGRPIAAGEGDLTGEGAVILLRVGENRRPKTVVKPWGEEIWFAETERYAGKLLRVRAGERLSVQVHEHKDESSYLLSGRIVVSQGPSAEAMESFEAAPGACWRSEPGLVHSLEALEDSVVVEVSTPEVNDVIRLADAYGRAG
jgi:mannose-6-phosphate isomerase-like protein (cupin superfamily)